MMIKAILMKAKIMPTFNDPFHVAKEIHGPLVEATACHNNLPSHVGCLTSQKIRGRKIKKKTNI